MRKFATVMLLGSVLMLLLAGCVLVTPQPAPAPASQQEAAPAAEQEATGAQQATGGRQFIFVTHDLGAGIFAPVRRGMEDACAMINAECEFIGPQSYDPAEQVNLIEAAIARNPDGIATTRPEPGTYDDVIRSALDQGIIVVGFNTNDPTANELLPIPFVGQDFTNYGREWAREVMKVMPDGGDIAITNCCFGHYALEERIRSFTETLENEGGGKYTIREVINTGSDEEQVYAAIEAYHQANPDIDAIFGVDYYSGIIAQYIKANNLQGQLLTGGSDLAPGNIEGLENDYVAFGLGQNPYLQGFYPVMMMHLALEYDIRPVTIDTGTDVVTPENIEEYNPEFR
jgi:ABC-type sugar transport system substrate-binding protein